MMTGIVTIEIIMMIVIDGRYEKKIGFQHKFEILFFLIDVFYSIITFLLIFFPSIIKLKI